MESALTALLWVALALPLLLLLQRWINRHLQGVTYLLTGRPGWAVIAYAIILFPGVLLHELSHWLAARLLGVRTGRLSLLPSLERDGTIRLGYVEYYRHRSLDPVRESLIGAAPLLTGTVAILLIGLYVFNVSALILALESRQVEGLMDVLATFTEVPDLLLWIYLIFAISNAMMPSPSDRRAWPAFLLLLASAAGALYLLGLGDVLLPGLVGPAAVVFGYLGLAFTIAIGVDILFLLLLAVLEALLSRLKGVQVTYGEGKRAK
ncbi:MAG: hypothetical protein R3272_05435 [Candidatus Promineifilaceae bacterium]|nr:hypothetical protein [Candidatus Promineifilaceae bacterium]